MFKFFKNNFSKSPRLNLSKINKKLFSINFIEDIKGNKAIRVKLDNKDYFQIERSGKKYKLISNLSNFNEYVFVGATEARQIITKKILLEKSKNIAIENIIVDKIEEEINDLASSGNDLNFEESYYSKLTDCVKIDNEHIEKYKLYSFDPSIDDTIKVEFLNCLNNLKEIFNKQKNIEVLLGNQVCITKYAFEKEQEDINIKKEILSDLVLYFDSVLESVLNNKNISFREKTNTPVNIVIPKDSGIGIYNIKLANFFEVYSSILKMGLIDNKNNLIIPKNQMLVFSVYDFFRTICTMKKINKTYKCSTLIVRKPTVRVLDRLEIDFIIYEKNKLYICDSKLKISYMTFKRDEFGNIIDEYRDISKKFIEYKNILFGNLHSNLESIFRKNRTIYENDNSANRKELQEFAEKLKDADLDKELLFRSSLNKFIKRIEDNNEFGGFKLQIGNLQNKVGNYNFYKIESFLNKEEFLIEDVFNGFKVLKYTFNGKPKCSQSNSTNKSIS